MRLPATREIGICLPHATSHAQGVVAGIFKYCRSHGRWQYTVLSYRSDYGISAIRKRMRSRGLAGVILDAWYPQMLRAFVRIRLPVVEIGGAWPADGAYSIIPDNVQVGRLGAQHLREKGLRNFAFYGTSGLLFSEQRERGFQEELASVPGIESLQSLDLPKSLRQNPERERACIARFLRKAHRPLGVMCSHDYRAKEVLLCCQEMRLRVPEDVAIVGSGNDHFSSEASSCPITSVDLSPATIGWTAARCIDRLSRGLAGPKAAVLIEPAGVIPRLSSDVLMVDDRNVADAIRFIREHAHERIDVRDVLHAVPVSRRTLELNCLRLLGRSPRQEIFRCHIEHAKRLLTDTHLPLKVVAEQSGFTSQSTFAVIFKRATGLTPLGYRQAATE